MAVIGTFGSFTAARLGIYSSQSAMNLVGNNISNINTKGYTRQRLDISSLYNTGDPRYANGYNLNIGYGALANQVSAPGPLSGHPLPQRERKPGRGGGHPQLPRPDQPYAR